MSLRTSGAAILAAVLLAIAWQWAPAQPTEDSDASLDRLGRRINAFLVSIAKGELDEQFEQLLDRSPLAKDRKKLNQLREAIRQETQKYGNFREVEQVRLELRGQSLARAVNLYKCQDYPLVWDFTFYRINPEEEWTLIALRFHVDYEKL